MSAKLVKQIKERIKEEGGIDQIVELNLEELRITSITNDIKKVLEKAKNLQILVLADNDLENVDNLPKLDLTVLDLSANKVNESALKRIAQFTELGQLLLAGNEIKTFEGLKPLFALTKLLELDLSENPVAELAGYRELLFKEIPSLETLDHSDKDGNPVEESLSDADSENNESQLDSDEGEGSSCQACCK